MKPVAFESLLARLSAGFLTLPVAEVDAAITDALRRIVGILGVDRTQLIRFGRSYATLHVTHSGATRGVAEGAPDVSLARAFPWAVARIRRGEITAFARLDDLPPEAATDRVVWQRYGVKSELIMPLLVDGRVDGAIVLDCDRVERTWLPDLIVRTEALATIFGNALAYKRAREALDAAMQFERATSTILARLLAAAPSEHDALLEAGLCEVAQAFGADRVTLWRRGGEPARFAVSHHWLADDGVAPSDPRRAPFAPWINAQLEQALVVHFTRHADLPPQAAADLESLRSMRIGAAVVVPLQLGGAVVGALSFATAREGVEWPDALVPRAQLLGNALVSFLARQLAEHREREAQAQAAHASRVGTMGVFAASLVHELTQPLAASLANAETAAELLEVPALDLDELRATVADVVVDTRRASELIQRLRRFLRHGDTERVDLDLRASLVDVLGIVASDAVERRLTISLDVPEVLPPLVGDRVQLQQVLLNLLLNAFDAVAARPPGDRQVQVTARPTRTSLRVEVTDNGTGLDEAALARVFQPFFTTKPGGMGLGLSISRTIVASHGGTLTAQSGPGLGSTFRIELPLRQPLVIATAPNAAVPAKTDETVFVIDDDDAVRGAIERQLRAEGYRVEAFANAHAFLDRLPHDDIACIVSDVRMPGMSGLDLQATLARARNEWPVVFVSGHGDIPTTVHAMKAGAAAFLPKPFSKLELLAAVADALARSRECTVGRRQNAEVLASHRSLTPREREVFTLVVQGRLNKVIADRLGIAETTVKIHRGRVMEKMHAGTVADLVRMAARIAAPQDLPVPVV